MKLFKLFAFAVIFIASSAPSFAIEIETIASATSDADIIQLLSGPSGAVYENSHRLNESTCLIMAYPHKIAAYTAVGFNLVKARLARTEFLERGWTGIYFQERLTLYFTFEKVVGGDIVTEKTQVNCATKRTRPDGGFYK